MTIERRKSDRRVSPALAEFALEERGELLARIASLELQVFQMDNSITSHHWENTRLRYELEQHRVGVVLPARCMELTFTERPTNYAIGWNACLDEVARLNPSSECVAVDRELLATALSNPATPDEMLAKIKAAEELRALLAQQGKENSDGR